MRMMTVFTVAVLLPVVVTVGCGEGGEPGGPFAPFELSVDSLGITGEVDDPEVSEVNPCPGQFYVHLLNFIHLSGHFIRQQLPVHFRFFSVHDKRLRKIHIHLML